MTASRGEFNSLLLIERTIKDQDFINLKNILISVFLLLEMKANIDKSWLISKKEKQKQMSKKHTRGQYTRNGLLFGVSARVCECVCVCVLCVCVL